MAMMPKQRKWLDLLIIYLKCVIISPESQQGADDMPRKRTLEERQAQIALGERIRVRRRALGMSQNLLASKAGVRFQQVQNYEIGKDMVPSDRLELIAEALQTTPSQLLGEMQESDQAIPLHPELREFLMRPNALKLLEAMNRLPDEQNKRVVGLVFELTGTPYQ